MKYRPAELIVHICYVRTVLLDTAAVSQRSLFLHTWNTLA